MSNTRPRILILGPDLHKPKPGGIVSVIRVHLASGLQERYALSWLSLEYEGNLLQKMKALVLQLFRLWRAFRQNQYDLIHVHASLYQSVVLRLFFILLVKRWTKAPMILQFHGGTVSQIKRYRTVFVKQLRHFACILVLTDEQKKGLIETAKVPEDRIALVPNFLLTPEVTLLPEAVSSRPPSILFMGRMIREKGIFKLVDAIYQLKAIIEGRVEVVMAGNGPAFAELRAYIRTRGLEKIIQLPGYVTGVQHQQLLQKGNIFVLPSYREGFPMGILEAMVYGQAIIATNRGQTKDIVQEDNGILLPNADPEQLATALLELINHPERVQRMGKVSMRLFKEKFSMEKEGVARFSSIYDQLLQS